MSFPPSSRTPSGPRRRSLLAVPPAVLLAAGCSAGARASGAGAGSRPSAAERARARAARDSRELAGRYDAVIAAHPKLAERLRPLREEVVRHAEAFGAGAGAPGEKAAPAASGAPGASGAATASGVASSPAPVAPSVPASEKDALAQLAAAERELAARRTEALVDVPGELARLLASVAAAGAAHVFLLTEG